jgi:hypothetical protein
MDLKKRQEEMKARVKAARDAAAAAKRRAGQKLLCPICRINSTSLDKNSALKPCKACAGVARRLDTAESDFSLPEFGTLLRRYLVSSRLLKRQNLHDAAGKFIKYNDAVSM